MNYFIPISATNTDTLNYKSISHPIYISRPISIPIPISYTISAIPIPIQKSPTSQFRDNETTYILKQNSFDPLKNSPPNEFMSKLKSRMNSFN